MAASSSSALAGRTALVVGGTNGIGRGLAEWLAGQGASVVVAGRSEERGREVVEAMRAANADGRHAFAQVDAMRIRDINRFCAEFQQAHDRLDHLVLTAGIASMAGYTPTEEGIDQKLAVHYYGRVALILGLVPLLEATAAKGADVRVLSVLSGGVHRPYTKYREDPELVRNFSIPNAANAAGFYNDLALDALAREHPTIAFAHAAPGFVGTAWGSDFNPLLRGGVRLLQRLFSKSPAECARLIGPALTAPEYAKGFHIVDQYGRPGKVTALQDEARDFVWAHTKEVLARAAGAGDGASAAPAGSSS